MSPKNNRNRLVGFYPISESNCSLGYIYVVLSWFFCPSNVFTCPAFLLCPFRPLLFLRIRLYFTHCRTINLQFQASLFLPSPCYRCYQTPLRLHTQIQYCMSHKILDYGVMVVEDVHVYLLQACSQHCFRQWRLLPMPSASICGYIPANRRAALWWKPPRVRPIWGVISRVSDLKKSFSWTVTLYNIPEVQVYSPSRYNILYTWSHFCRSLWKFNITSRQSSYDVVNTLPGYLDYDTAASGRP